MDQDWTEKRTSKFLWVGFGFGADKLDGRVRCAGALCSMGMFKGEVQNERPQANLSVYLPRQRDAASEYSEAKIAVEKRVEGVK